MSASPSEASEQSHMDHPDFRVGGKIFASLGPEEDWGMVKLTPEEQAPLVADEPRIFQPALDRSAKRRPRPRNDRNVPHLLLRTVGCQL